MSCAILLVQGRERAAESRGVVRWAGVFNDPVRLQGTASLDTIPHQVVAKHDVHMQGLRGARQRRAGEREQRQSREAHARHFCARCPQRARSPCLWRRGRQRSELGQDVRQGIAIARRFCHLLQAQPWTCECGLHSHSSSRTPLSALSVTHSRFRAMPALLCAHAMPILKR